MKNVIFSMLLLAGMHVFAANDSLFIRVHFLHGSKPKHKYRFVEDRWFGGMLGGHAGIELAPNRIFNFQPMARFHFFSKRKIINSRFTFNDTTSFYSILCNKPDSVKKTIIVIPITAQQKFIFDSLAAAYQERCPFDYAFFGMRCGAAAYHVLSVAGVVKRYSFGKTWRKIFYPRKLRRRLEKMARKNGYSILRYEGNYRRKWERD